MNSINVLRTVPSRIGNDIPRFYLQQMDTYDALQSAKFLKYRRKIMKNSTESKNKYGNRLLSFLEDKGVDFDSPAFSNSDSVYTEYKFGSQSEITYGMSDLYVEVRKIHISDKMSKRWKNHIEIKIRHENEIERIDSEFTISLCEKLDNVAGTARYDVFFMNIKQLDIKYITHHVISLAHFKNNSCVALQGSESRMQSLCGNLAKILQCNRYRLEHTKILEYTDEITYRIQEQYGLKPMIKSVLECIDPNDTLNTEKDRSNKYGNKLLSFLKDQGVDFNNPLHTKHTLVALNKSITSAMDIHVEIRKIHLIESIHEYWRHPIEIKITRVNKNGNNDPELTIYLYKRDEKGYQVIYMGIKRLGWTNKIEYEQVISAFNASGNLILNGRISEMKSLCNELVGALYSGKYKIEYTKILNALKILN